MNNLLSSNRNPSTWFAVADVKAGPEGRGISRLWPIPDGPHLVASRAAPVALRGNRTRVPWPTLGLAESFIGHPTSPFNTVSPMRSMGHKDGDPDLQYSVRDERLLGLPNSSECRGG